MANASYESQFYENAARAEISRSIVSKKNNVCPFTIRLAWHASGTYDDTDKTGGSDGCGKGGASMRFDPEINWGANAGLSLMQDIIKPVKDKFPELSYADLWTLAGAQAVKLCGGPDIPFHLGRSDAKDSSVCPSDGRLPDAAQGAGHLRDIFYRMGFGDKEIVALSGAHTLGSCHRLRSGFDGPWTTNPLKFDNEYFRNLINLEWKPREWDGPLQYEDPSGKLMMLPSDMALVQDEKFLPWVKKYAEDEEAFRADFADAFSRLIALGCPAKCQPNVKVDPPKMDPDKEFRDLAMHGSLERMKEIAAKSNIDSQEFMSNRTPLMKASYFGHSNVVEYLLELKAGVNAADADGDTALHDAAFFGHKKIVELLLAGGADESAKNNDGKTPLDLAKKMGKDEVVALLS